MTRLLCPCGCHSMMFGFEGRICFHVGLVLAVVVLLFGEVGSAKGLSGMVPGLRLSSCASMQASVDLENGLWKRIGFGGVNSGVCVNWIRLGGDCPDAGLAWKENAEW